MPINLYLLSVFKPNCLALSIRKRIVLLSFSTLCLAFVVTPILSQQIEPEPIFKQFTVDDGLPSNELYHVIQDSSGYIWVASTNGVSRFDGYQFYNYNLEDGLVESTIHEIFIDYRDRLWFIANSGKLALFDKEIISAYPYNYRIDSYVDKSRGPVKKSFYVDTLDNVYLSLKGVSLLSISKEGILKAIHQKNSSGNVIIDELPDGKILVNNKMSGSDNFITFKGLTSSFDIKNWELGLNIDGVFHFFFMKDDSDSYIITSKSIIARVKNGVVVEKRTMDFEIIWASIDKYNNLWIASNKGGVYLFKDKDFMNYGNKFLGENLVSSVTQDRENGYWFSTLGNGLFYCPNIYALTFNKASGLNSNKITSVFCNRDGIFIGDEEGIVSNIKNKKLIKYNIQKELSTIVPIRYLGYDSTSTKVWVATSNYIHSLDKGNSKVFMFKDDRGGIYPREIIPSLSGDYWVACSWGIRKFNGKDFIYNSREEAEFSGVVYTVFEDSTGLLWMGAVNGVWTYNNSTYSYLGESNNFFAHQTNHIVQGPNGTTLFATRGVGLIIKDGDVIYKISQSDGLASNYINKIFVDNDGIWLATSNGVNFIEGDLRSKYKISHINTSHGLPTNEVNSVFVRGNQLLVATSKGLTVINKTKISYNRSKPRVKITSLRIRDKEINLNSDPIRLTYDQNYISIDYVGLSYRNMGRTRYRYRLMGLDSLWLYSNTTNTTYSGIKFGDYTFEVQAQNSDGIWGDSTKFSFTISPPFWQTYWFILLLTLIFSGTIYLIYRNRIMSIRRRNELINNLNIYKQQSLRQQMNPHFIFNTLNSIQLYILEKDHISSHKYLTKFAKLMRMILDNSQQPTITLKDEIDALKLYLELESIRLSGRFEYFIDIENNDLLSCQIPTLLIQPFVENSIWHGIMLKPEQDGWVKISINSNDGTIICTIEDNGVGREAAQAIRSKQEVERKSLGFKITAKRIELLNSLYKDKFSITYTDLSTSEGKSSGTRVELKIPYSINQSESS